MYNDFWNDVEFNRAEVLGFVCFALIIGAMLGVAVGVIIGSNA